MRLLIGVDSIDGRTEHRLFVSSFVIYDHQASPVVLGVEYPVQEGIVRTFADATSPDFLSTLRRSSVPHLDRVAAIVGVPCLFVVPFLGKGIPERIVGVSKVLAINDHGKELFVANRLLPTGTFATATYSDHNFDNLVKSVFN